MSKWPGRFRFLFYVLLGLIAILAMLYSLVCLMPTGFEELAEEQSAAVEAVNKRLAARSASAAKIPPTSVESSPIPPSDLWNETDDLLVGVEQLNELAAKACRWERDFRNWGKPAKDDPTVSFPPRMRHFHTEIPAPDSVATAELDDEGHLLKLEISQEGWNAVKKAVHEEMAKIAHDEMNASVIRRTEDLVDGAMAVDLAERFLKRDDIKTPSFEKSWRSHYHSPRGGFATLAGASTLTAARAGDVDRAADTLALAAERIRIVYELGYPAYPLDGMYNLSVWMLTLADREMMSAVDFERVARVWEGAQISEDQSKELLAAHVARTRDFAFRFLDNPPYHLARWPFEQSVHKLLRPVAKRTVDKGLMAIAEKDYEAAMSSHNALIRLGEWSNDIQILAQKFLFAYVPREYVNQPLAQAQIVAATAAFRSRTGRWPQSLDELTGDCLPEDFPRTLPEYCQVWAVFSVPSRTIPTLHDDLDNATDYFDIMVERFQQDHGALPESPEDLRPYVNEEFDLESFRDRFVSVDEIPVFARLSYAKFDSRNRVEVDDDLKIHIDKNFYPVTENPRLLITGMIPIMPSDPEKTLDWMCDADDVQQSDSVREGR